MTQGTDQGVAAFAVVEQIVFQIRIALHHPDVAQHLVEHACRTAGDALAAQFVEYRPVVGAEQADDDLAVGKRGVVVGDFAQAGSHGSSRESVKRWILPYCGATRGLGRPTLPLKGSALSRRLA
ncbi:hypothetical protein SDC9_211497 [bioreactor metagenome]|uniref:Uncharacterized protein n=1 Tax=bioreactor metagenome TaxID=1076179 RepID=A0A645JJJ1_9ZZZZ